MSSAPSSTSRFLSLCVLLLSCGCERAQAEANPSEGGPPPLEGSRETAAATSSPAAAQASYEEEAFHLTLKGPATSKVGESVEFVVLLTAQGGYKVNPEYPIKFTFEPTDGVVPEVSVLKKENGTVEKARAELRGKVKLEKAGGSRVQGKLSFSVCTDERCLIEKRELALPLTAS